MKRSQRSVNSCPKFYQIHANIYSRLSRLSTAWGLNTRLSLVVPKKVMVFIHISLVLNTGESSDIYIDGSRSVDHRNRNLVTPVNRQRQSDGYQ